MYVIDLTAQALLDVIPFVGSSAILINPAGTRAYVASPFGMSVIDTSTNTVVAQIPIVGAGQIAAAMNSTGTRLYVNNSGTILVIDTATNTVVGNPITVGVGPSGIAVTPAGTRLLVTTQTSDTASLVDVGTASVIATVSLPAESLPGGLAVPR